MATQVIRKNKIGTSYSLVTHSNKLVGLVHKLGDDGIWRMESPPLKTERAKAAIRRERPAYQDGHLDVH